MGVGGFVATILLTVISFPQSATPGLVDAEIIRNLGIAYIFGLWSFYSLAIITLGFYKIDERKHEQNLAILKNKNEL